MGLRVRVDGPLLLGPDLSPPLPPPLRGVSGSPPASRSIHSAHASKISLSDVFYSTRDTPDHSGEVPDGSSGC